MAYYLVDFENVKSRGMEGIHTLTESDTICIFYSENANSMTFELHQKLNETQAKVIYQKVLVGTKNALDFQLATYLGYLICENQQKGEEPTYFIVTKDNGFSSLRAYWVAQKVSVRLIHTIPTAMTKEAVAAVTVEEPTPEELAAQEPEEEKEGVSQSSGFAGSFVKKIVDTVKNASPLAHETVTAVTNQAKEAAQVIDLSDLFPDPAAEVLRSDDVTEAKAVEAPGEHEETTSVEKLTEQAAPGEELWIDMDAAAKKEFAEAGEEMPARKPRSRGRRGGRSRRGSAQTTTETATESKEQSTPAEEPKKNQKSASRKQGKKQDDRKAEPVAQHVMPEVAEPVDIAIAEAEEAAKKKRGRNAKAESKAEKTTETEKKPVKRGRPSKAEKAAREAAALAAAEAANNEVEAKKTEKPAKSTKSSGNAKTSKEATETKASKSEKPSKTKASTSKKTAEPAQGLITEAEVAALLKDPSIAAKVTQIVNQYKTKQSINNALGKEFRDNDKTAEVYSALKPLLKNKK